MIHTQSEIDNLVELAIIQRAELKKLVESLPQLRDHLSSEIERNLEEIEPAIRSELEQFVTARALDAHAQTSTALTAKIDELARSLETTTAARYSVLIAEREKNESLLAQAEARIAEAASALPGSVKEIVAGELARFPRAGEIDQLRKEFAEPKGLNPRGKWSPDETYQRLDLVTINGDSFVSNIDGNRERPSRSAADWTLNAARGNSGGGGGITSLTDLLPIPSSGQILGSEGTSYVPKNLVAGSNITITETPTTITITGDEGQIELQDGTAAAPSLFFVNDTDTGLFRVGANTLGIAVGGTQAAAISSATFAITPNTTIAGTLTANGTTIPASKTLVVTTDKISALAATTSAELAGVISDETGTGSLVFSSSPTLVTPDLGTPSALVGTNITGTAAGLTAGNVTTNANLTGDVTSVGNATSIAAGVIVDADINASAAIADTKLATISTAGKVSNSATTATSSNTASAIVARDASGNFTAGTITANLTGNVSGSSGSTTGNAATATALQTARAINGVNFDGTSAITVTAAAGTLSGTTLAAGVTASSLTSLGTIASLTATAGTVANAPSGSTDIANKSYVDTVAQGLDAKASCVAATTADITLSGAQTIDGVSIVAGNRVLVKDQTLSENNGIYLCASGAWTRTTDADTWDELTSAFTFIEQGTVNADTGYVCTANAGGTLGTTALPWSQFSGAGTFTAGTGLTLTGSVFSLTSPVAVANGGTGLTSLGSGIATFLGTPSSANLAAAVSDETGSGALVFASSPTLVTPTLGAATATSLNGVTLTGTSTPALSVTGTASVSGSNTGDQTTITGNAGSATILQTARNINGVSFNGSADITVTAAAGTLTGATLASGVTASSLTSLGTITSLTATALTVNDNTTLGSSNTDTVVFNARVASDINPSTDDTYDLGVTGHEWRNLNIDGTANIDSLVADSADINGGTIDGTTIGATTPSTVAATTITAQNASFQIVAQTSGSTRMTLDHNGTNGRVGTLDAQDVYIVRANVPVAVFGSTGLNSTAIGATTASTGAFTTLAASSASLVTFSGGTVAGNTGKLKLQASDSDYGSGISMYYRPSGADPSARAWQIAPNFIANGNLDFVISSSNSTDPNSTAILSCKSTGLAVTGTLSATGAINNTATGGVFTTSGATTNARYASFQSTGANFVVGSDNSAGTAFITGGSAYSGVIATQNAASVFIGVNSAKVAEFSSTGLAVTGALSSTGQITSSRARSDTLGDVGLAFGAVSQWGWRDDTSNRANLDYYNGATWSNMLQVTGGTGLAVTGALSATGEVSTSSVFRASGGANDGRFDASFTGSVSGLSLTSSDNASDAYFAVFRKSDNTPIGTIRRVTTTDAVAFNTTSDRRIKENFGLLTDSGRLIDSLTPRTFDRLDGTDTDRKGWLGFVAQEVYAADPIFSRIGFVTKGDDHPTEVSKVWAVGGSPLDALLVAELKSLRARVAALESK